VSYPAAAASSVIWKWVFMTTIRVLNVSLYSLGVIGLHMATPELLRMAVVIVFI